MENNRQSKGSNESKNHSNKGDRIAKVMARAGLCSRRDAEKWIAEGRVVVDGVVLTTPAFLIYGSEEIVVDGNKLPSKDRTRLFLYHKPAGLVTTHRDEKGRETIFDKFPAEFPRVVTVGRLDINTEGLLLLTNDGELSRYLELPQTGVKRTYRVRVHGRVYQDRLDNLKKGIRVDGIRYSSVDVKIDEDLSKKEGHNAWLEVSLKEGKNREVRKVMDAVGLTVNRLIRTTYGPFHLANLERGAILEVKYGQLKSMLPNYFKN